MCAKAFRAFGVVTIFVDCIVFSVATGGRLTSYSLEGRLKMTLAYFVVGIIGLGLIYLRKWAAAYFSLFLFYFGVWFAWSAIKGIADMPFPFNLIWLCEGISLMLPLAFTIHFWPQLSWRGKGFF